MTISKKRKRRKAKKRSIAAKIETKIMPGLYVVRVARSTRFRKKLIRIQEV